MIKSIFKRSWLSITRKPSKTVVLGIVMFVIANLVLASIAIKNAVNESTEFAKLSLGSTVYLSADMDKLREEAIQESDSSSGGEMIRMRIERPDIPIDMVNSIGDSDYVKDYTYGINATAKEKDFSALENNMSSGGPSFGTAGGSITSLYGNMSIIGINSYAFINEVQNKTMELVEGTYFDEKTDNQIIISYELAEENELSVGDKIKLINEEIDIENYDPRSGDPKVTSSNTYELEIIGIYDVNTDNFNGNTIYMNVDTAAKFLKEDKQNDGNYGVDNIVYYLNSADDAEMFINEANNKFPNMTDDNLKLDINNEAYDKMVGPIEQVGSFAGTVLWLVIIASVLIIALIINNNIKDRKYEMGVLMSLGGSKLNIIWGILMELVIVGTIGFALSTPTSYFLANNMGKSLLDKQLKIAEQETEDNFGRPGMRIGGGTFNVIGENNPTDPNIETIDNIDVSVGVTDYLILFLIGYVIIGGAMIVPAINIVKYDPKTILTGRL